MPSRLGLLFVSPLNFNYPAGRLHVLDDADTPVPPDGMCAYHCLEAMKDLLAWRRGRKESGYAEDRARLQEDKTKALAHRAEIISLAEGRGMHEKAARLKKDNKDG